MNTWVFDTNVLISGLISRVGPSASLVDAFFANSVRLAYDQRILEEYADVMARPKFQILPAERLSIFLKLRASSPPVRAKPLELELPDEDDRPFIEVAFSTEERVLVTRNQRDYPGAEEIGVRLLAPEAALDELYRPST